VSYALLQRDAEAFAGRAGRPWWLDEAQAIKNARQAQPGGGRRCRPTSGWRCRARRSRTAWRPVVDHEAVNPGLLGSAARSTERFGNPIERHRNRGAQRAARG
jgi:hypothetical protein